MDVSIIIVNWNSREFLRSCIASIQAWTKGIVYEVLVIDSGSFDGSEEMLARAYPDVRFIQSPENLGFAKANNVAFRASAGRNILFLNPDTEIEGPTVQTLHGCLESTPNAGVVGAKLLNSDRSIQTTCVRAFPTILNQLLDSDVLRRALPRAGIWGTAPLFSGKLDPSEVDAVSGACLMVKRSVFEAVGMFSEDYFMYSEDIELCFQARRAGWKAYYVPTAVATHHGGQSSAKSAVNAFASVMMLESRWRFFRKTRSTPYCLLYRAVMLLASISRIALAVALWPLYGLRGRADVMRGVVRKWGARLRWTLGGEGWVKSG